MLPLPNCKADFTKMLSIRNACEWMIVLLILLRSSIGGTAAEDYVDWDEPNGNVTRYDGAQVWEIHIHTERERQRVQQLENRFQAQIWMENEQNVQYVLRARDQDAAAQYLSAANMTHVVILENLQELIDEEGAERQPASRAAPTVRDHGLTWKAYYRITAIYSFLDFMARKYSDICKLKTIGKSIHGRPLKVLIISNGQADNPGIWIDSLTHGREWITITSTTYIIKELLENWNTLPAHITNTDWYIMPAVNPDGYEYSHTNDRLWRKNRRIHGNSCDGVDLNRNFAYQWGGRGSSGRPCKENYRGKKPFSEPETLALSKYMLSLPPDTFKVFLSYHSFGQKILYPWGYSITLPLDNDELKRGANLARKAMIESTGATYQVINAARNYKIDGSSIDWAKGNLWIKYPYILEMRKTGDFGFVLPPRYILPNAQDAYVIAETFARIIHDLL